MNVSLFDFDLPPELIAQEPPAERGGSRLLVLDRETGAVVDRQFRDLPDLLQPGDLLVVNDTRVFPARLLGKRLPGGGAVECLLVRRLDTDNDEVPPKLAPDSIRAKADEVPPKLTDGVMRTKAEIWEALVHPGQRLRPGSRMEFGAGARAIHGEILDRHFHGRRSVRLWTDDRPVAALVDAIGHVPLPPYIKRADAGGDRDRYQTVYAQYRGSIAAPTAGLHFTQDMLDRLAGRGVERTAITLHVGYGTFQPIRVDDADQHRMEPETFDIPPPAADAISAALAENRRVIAVGTTTTRALESLALLPTGGVGPESGMTRLFIRPGHRFRVVSGLITNFHLPRSSLVMLVSAFAGRERLLDAYHHAIAQSYRFYSYGDAMLIL